MTRTRTALVATLTVLSVALPASAAGPNGKWKGRVTRFNANTNMFCTNGGGLKMRMLYHDRPVRIRNGKFKFEGESEDGATYEFKGAISGRRAKGTLGFHDGTWTPSGVSFCNATDVKWKAKQR